MEISSCVDTERDLRSSQERWVKAQVKVGSCGTPYLVFLGTGIFLLTHSGPWSALSHLPVSVCGTDSLQVLLIREHEASGDTSLSSPEQELSLREWTPRSRRSCNYPSWSA